MPPYGVPFGTGGGATPLAAPPGRPIMRSWMGVPAAMDMSVSVHTSKQTWVGAKEWRCWWWQWDTMGQSACGLDCMGA